MCEHIPIKKIVTPRIIKAISADLKRCFVSMYMSCPDSELFTKTLSWNLSKYRHILVWGNIINNKLYIFEKFNFFPRF